MVVDVGNVIVNRGLVRGYVDREPGRSTAFKTVEAMNTDDCTSVNFSHPCRSCISIREADNRAVQFPQPVTFHFDHIANVNSHHPPHPGWIRRSIFIRWEHFRQAPGTSSSNGWSERDSMLRPQMVRSSSTRDA